MFLRFHKCILINWIIKQYIIIFIVRLWWVKLGTQNICYNYATTDYKLLLPTILGNILHWMVLEHVVCVDLSDAYRKFELTIHESVTTKAS